METIFVEIKKRLFHPLLLVFSQSTCHNLEVLEGNQQIKERVARVVLLHRLELVEIFREYGFVEVSRAPCKAIHYLSLLRSNVPLNYLDQVEQIVFRLQVAKINGRYQILLLHQRCPDTIVGKVFHEGVVIFLLFRNFFQPQLIHFVGNLKEILGVACLKQEFEDFVGKLKKLDMANAD